MEICNGSNNVMIIIDRFIIIDRSIVYHCGASFKDLVKKCFVINKIEDEMMVNSLLNEIGKITPISWLP